MKLGTISRRFLSGLAGLATITSLGAAALMAPSTAEAQVISRFVLRGEGGAGTIFSRLASAPVNQGGGGLGVNILGSGRLGFSIVDALAIQVGYSTWFWPSDGGSAQLHNLTGGLRLEPMAGNVGRFFIDANAGAAFATDRGQMTTRVTFDAGLGFEFQLVRGVGLGPFGRFGMTLRNTGDWEDNAMYWAAGASLSLRVPSNQPGVAPPPPPNDADRDGIIDANDLCPNDPPGAHPSRLRRGCPDRDTDGDEIYDSDDQCPDRPTGAIPDPDHWGCPATDTDSDGVGDREDQCPTVPRGNNPDPDRRGCPDGDEDSDGVTNHLDQCPREPQGLIPDPERLGCPAPDRDNDRVIDSADACPDQAGAPSTEPARNGCPGLVVIDGDTIRIMTPVFFATRRANILPRSRPVLQAVADALVATPQIRRVSVEGHTDDVGDDNANMQLSQRRAESVVQALVQRGVDGSRLEAHGLGETRPVTPVTPEMSRRDAGVARGQNRRVEFHITDPAPRRATEGAATTPATPAQPTQ